LIVNDDAPAPYNSLTSSLSGTGVADATLAPASVGFGNVAISTPSDAKSFTLKNNQLAALNISGIALSSPDFAQTNTCGSSLAAKGSCTISVTLTPSVLGTESATLTVNDDAPSPYNALSSSLSGTGIADVTLAPASVDFGNVAINTASDAKGFTLKNNQLVALNISSITLSNPDFAQTNTCGSSLAAKSSCAIGVTLTPSVLGTESATLTVNDDAPAPYNALTSSLSGTGVAQATVSPASLTFSTQTVGTSTAAKTVTLRNNLTTTLAISSITFTGADPGDFGQTSTCGGSLAAQSTCTISVTFTPGATGARTATLNLYDSANNSPQTVSLTGTGK